MTLNSVDYSTHLVVRFRTPIKGGAAAASEPL